MKFRLTSFVGYLRTNRLVRQGAEMVGWRMLSTLFGAAGAVWAARCLGPDGLGVSGLILAIGGNIVYGIGLQMNSAFVRRYKAESDEGVRFELTAQLTSFRFCVATALCVLALIVLVFAPIPERWFWPSVACLPFVLLSALDLGWVLMARQDQHLQQRVVTLRNVLTTLAYLAFFRPGIAAGWDIVVADAVLAVCIALTWRQALGRFRGVLSWSRARACIPILWNERVLAGSAAVSFGYYSAQMPLIGALAGVRELGLVRSANQIVAPFERTMRMLNGLLYPKLIDWHQASPLLLWRRQRKLVIAAFAMAIVTGGLGACIFPFLMPLVMGQEFSAAAWPCALLLSARCVLVAQESLCSGLWAQYRERDVMRVMAGMIPVLGLLLWWAVPRWGALGATAALLVSESVATLLLIRATWVAVRSAPSESSPNYVTVVPTSTD